MITKANLTARKRKQGGSLVRVSAAWIEAQQARNAKMLTALGVDSIHAWNSFTAETVFVVIDLYDRKTFNQPNRVGIAVQGSGVAYGIDLADITEIISARWTISAVIAGEELYPLDDDSPFTHWTNQLSAALVFDERDNPDLKLPFYSALAGVTVTRKNI